MRLEKKQFIQLTHWVVGVAYFSLVFWMHIWTLEGEIPQPGEPTIPHHQVCTWLGTCGEAGLVSFDFPGSPKPSVSTYAVTSSFVFVPFSQPSTIHVRGPPSPSV